MRVFYNGGYMMGMHGGWWLICLLVIVVLMLFGWGRTCRRRDPSRESPHEVLQKRLARGELSVQDYEERKALLDRDTDGK
jgi:putative membrane protein